MTFKTYSWPFNKSMIKIKTITEKQHDMYMNCEILFFYSTIEYDYCIIHNIHNMYLGKLSNCEPELFVLTIVIFDKC